MCFFSLASKDIWEPLGLTLKLDSHVTSYSKSNFFKDDYGLMLSKSGSYCSPDPGKIQSTAPAGFGDVVCLDPALSLSLYLEGP